MKNIIVANWKMNPASVKEAESLFTSVKEGMPTLENTEVVICPPFVYLPLLKGLTLGAQNMFYKEKGAFTGEISSLMLKDLGTTYILLGHSEVRKYLQETSEVVNKKIREAVNVGLFPILCIGENAEEKGRREEILIGQITEALSNISESHMKDIIIAYEPVWAIGTGDSCSIEETRAAALFIRKVVEKLYSKEVAENMRILYGGSVDSTNSSLYLQNSGIQGLLVGGKSLIAEDFVKIIASAN